MSPVWNMKILPVSLWENISSTNCIASIYSDQGRLLKTETDILAYKGSTHNQSLFIFIINVSYKNVMLQKKKLEKLYHHDIAGK